MATSKAKKNQALSNARELFQSGKNLVLSEYRGMTVEQSTDLRRKFRKAGMKFKVLKNTLTKKLLQEFGIAGLDDQLAGPVAVTFLGQDAAASAKSILAYSKENELLIVKAGYIEGKVVDKDGLKAISELPPREVLLGMLLSTMQGPTKNLLSVLNGNTRKLIYALNAIKEQKAKQAA